MTRLWQQQLQRRSRWRSRRWNAQSGMTDLSASPNEGLSCSSAMRISLHEYFVTGAITCDDKRLPMTPAPFKQRFSSSTLPAFLKVLQYKPWPFEPTLSDPLNVSAFLMQQLPLVYDTIREIEKEEGVQFDRSSLEGIASRPAG